MVGIFGKAQKVVEVVLATKKDDGYSRDVSTCPGMSTSTPQIITRWKEGYTVASSKETEHGMTAELRLAGSEMNAFGKDIHDLVLEVEYQSEHSKPSGQRLRG
jgi:hypothetical protein